MTIFETDAAYVASTYARFPLNLVKGKGSLVWDETGKEYIDLGSGIAVNSFGFCDEEWVNAVTEQLHTFQHTSNLYYTSPCATLAKLLCERTGMKKVFFSNSGAEANECAIKTAHKYAADTKGAEYTTIVTLNNSFHGRTITTLAATGQTSFHEHFLPLTEGFVHCEPTPEDLKRVLEQHTVAAVMFEVIRGEGGVLPLETAFVAALKELAEQYDVLLIADEVQTGNGRTGKLYGYMH
ncbi:MAG: aminotransferase class III-fold pyridoxal phosphate-dependent enzyme, partial [Clostridia bacterium]|nr:aminotransferase class III-fold pyridoxal phosphate-dependent enzyme [Clostridia bacterium]